MPSLSQLAGMSASELQQIHDFKIVHKDFGSIIWKGVTDVNGLNLDEVVNFGDNGVEVFPGMADTAKNGHRLNKRAEVCLEGCWPKNKNGKREPCSDMKVLKKYETRLQKQQKNLEGVHFKDYDPRKGLWRFTVDSF